MPKQNKIEERIREWLFVACPTETANSFFWRWTDDGLKTLTKYIKEVAEESEESAEFELNRLQQDTYKMLAETYRMRGKEELKKEVLIVMTKEIQKYPNTPIKERNGKNTFELLVNIKKIIENLK